MHDDPQQRLDADRDARAALRSLFLAAAHDCLDEVEGPTAMAIIAQTESAMGGIRETYRDTAYKMPEWITDLIQTARMEQGLGD